MTNGELIEMITKYARDFREDKTSVSRNSHLTNMKEEPSQETKDAILVSFLNYIAYRHCIDYGFAVEDFTKK